MIIAGLQNLSLVDYPGHLAAAVFTQGCNFRCGYCQNPELVTCESDFGYSVDDFFRYISSRKDMIEGVVVTGGEPVIHKDLPEFLHRIKKMGFKVKLDTNGSDPDMLEKLFRDYLVDYVAIDIKTSLEKYGLLTDIPDIGQKVAESVLFTVLWSFDHEFRTTCVPGIVEEEDIRKMGELVKGSAKFCLQQFRPIVTFDKELSKVKPYAPEKIREFADILRPYVKEVEIRGL